MTRYTVMLFQEAYPEFIQLEKFSEGDKIRLYCYLLNENKSIHTLLFDGLFENDKQIDKTINELLNIKL